VSSAQRADAFLGSDLTFEDMERQRIEDYRVQSVRRERAHGEDTFVVRAFPRERRNYQLVEFRVAKRDWAILEVRYLRHGSETPARRIRAPRAEMKEINGHVLPTHLIVQNAVRGTTTEVFIRDLVVNPKIDDREISVWALEKGRGKDRGSPRN
jgi:hypothetical protein